MQIKIARIILGWDQKRLADEAAIGVATVQRAERADQPPITAANLFAIQRVLEQAGIAFIDDEERPGVRWRR
jgi:transcriptional regulator with XRE-family HTH domain